LLPHPRARPSFIGQWGHIPISEGEHSREYLSAPLDMVEHTSCWEWDVVTDEYLEKHRKTAIEQAGHTNVVTPERSAIMQDGEFAFQLPHEPEMRGDPSMEGTRYFWGNQGDYGKVHLPKDAKGMTAKLVGEDGTLLAEFPLTGGSQSLDWPAEARDQPGLVLKIHRNDRLVDAVIWPGSDSSAP
jgi:hypothetical protein